jgi:phage terminase large subunit-like protein
LLFGMDLANLHGRSANAAVLAELKKSMGPMAFSAQYQQQRVPAGGTLIRKEWLKTHSHMSLQGAGHITLSWDIALSETISGDYSAGVVLFTQGERFYVLEVVRDKFPFPELVSKIAEMRRRYSISTPLIEESPISMGLI